MDIIKTKYSPWKRFVHKWQARRNIPFRRKFFIGYDLYGNTYWEFTIDGNLSRLRRKMDPYRKELFEVDYFKTVPPQWLQWLRRTREEAPSLNELVQDQFRQQRLRILAKQADEKWKNEKWRLQQEANAKLQNELNRIESENKVREEEKGKEEEKKEEKGAILDSNPWKQADKLKDTNPIESATIKPR